jgi:transcriptional regulator with XRE-family HTH domain
MTYTIAPESPRRIASRKFALAFTAALASTGMSKRELASRLTGNRSSRSSIQLWARGQSLPTIENARRLDEILGTELEQLIIDSRLVECQNGCGRTVIVRGNAARTRYCGPDCAKQAAKVRTGLMPKRDTIMRRLGLHQGAVRDYCGACEPEGVCRTADCPLRPVSPLPLVGSA